MKPEHDSNAACAFVLRGQILPMLDEEEDRSIPISYPDRRGGAGVRQHASSVLLVTHKSSLIMTSVYEEGHVVSDAEILRQAGLFKTPFEERERDLNPRRILERALQEFLHSSAVPKAQKERVAARIGFLYEASGEEDDDEAPLSLESVKRCFAFLEDAPWNGYPTISVTANGDLLAEWKSADGEARLIVEFRSRNDIRFAIWIPDPRATFGRLQLSGSAAVRGLVGNLKDVGVWKAFEEHPLDDG